MLINKEFTTDPPSPPSGIQYFRIAKRESEKSDFRYRVGACLVVGKSIIKGFNKKKTHPIVANPNIHIKQSIHAELDCILKFSGKIHKGNLYVYRETRNGEPAMARPCEHCMSFLRDSGIKTIYYSTSEFPYYKSENL